MRDIEAGRGVGSGPTAAMRQDPGDAEDGRRSKGSKGFMTSDTNGRGEDLDTAAGAAAKETDAGTGAAPSGFAANAPDEAAASAGGDAERIAALEAENADVKDRLLRLAADMENLRRRTEREIKDARTYGVTGFAREMLAVADNLRRAIEAVPAEAKEHGEGGLNALLDGVEMTERSLLASMEKHGVKKLEPEGQRFDPNFHQAMFEVPNPNVPNNTVVQVVQAGYAIGDRVLRPAMVGVAKGGPKAAAPTGEPGTGEAG